MPANYDYKRRIGSIVRVSAAIKTFLQTGDRFYWKVPVADVNAATSSLAVTNRTLTVPLGLKLIAILTVFGFADNTAITYVSDIDADPNQAGAARSTVYNNAAVYNSGNAQVITNTSAQVSSSSNGTNALISLFTIGYIDTRGIL